MKFILSTATAFAAAILAAPAPDSNLEVRQNTLCPLQPTLMSPHCCTSSLVLGTGCIPSKSTYAEYFLNFLIHNKQTANQSANSGITVNVPTFAILDFYCDLLGRVPACCVAPILGVVSALSAES
jgi:hypothetical protein